MKMVVMTTVLLFLTCVMMEVHSQTQTYPFVRFGNDGPALSNHSYVDLTTVGKSDNGSDRVQCVTDLVTCCNSDYGTGRGDWYFPNGARLPFSYHADAIYEKRRGQQSRVDLGRRNNGIVNGIYWCSIETNAVNDPAGVEIVYVGLYASGGENYVQELDFLLLENVGLYSIMQ